MRIIRSKKKSGGLLCGIFFLFLPVLSCVSLSPLDPVARPVLAAAPEEVVPQWRPFAEDRGGGLAYFKGKTRSPRFTFHALRIDLSEPGLQMVVRDGAPGEDGPLSVTVSSFVRDNGLLAGMNATPFDPVSAREGERRINKGIVVSGGVTLSPPNSRFDALAWYTDGGPEITAQAELESAAGVVDAIGGFHQILRGGGLTERALAGGPRYPRSAAGISAGKRFLYLLVIDGSWFGGATEAETALLLRALGAWDGLNLDGGGSSALALRLGDGLVRVVNTPTHGGIPGRERAVAACLGVGLK
jgi:hypothetical protein